MTSVSPLLPHWKRGQGRHLCWFGPLLCVLGPGQARAVTHWQLALQFPAAGSSGESLQQGGERLEVGLAGHLPNVGRVCPVTQPVCQRKVVAARPRSASLAGQGLFSRGDPLKLSHLLAQPGLRICSSPEGCPAFHCSRAPLPVLQGCPFIGANVRIGLKSSAQLEAQLFHMMDTKGGRASQG